MAGQGLEMLAQAGNNAAATVTLIGALGGILAAVVGTVFGGRSLAHRNQSESEHAERVFRRIQHGLEGEDVRFSARRRPDLGDSEAREHDGMSAIDRIALQEAAIYLQHHRIALKHYSAFQWASLGAGLLGFSVVLVGAALAYFAGLDVGVLTAAAGAIPSAAGVLLFRQATMLSDRAAENLRGLEDGVRRHNALQAALAATAEIGDPAARNRMYEHIGMHMLDPGRDAAASLRGSVEPSENDQRDTGS